MVNRENFETIFDYTTFLNNFEGPLDLLLFLINKEEIAIEDIFVSQVTEQFLEYMKGLPALDVDKLTDYLNVAATILKIKAQSLVPLPDDEYFDQDDVEEEKAELIRALEEYRLIKEETKKLKELETVGYFFKEPDKNVGETKTVFSLDHLTLDGLVAAFSAVMLKNEVRKASAETREIPRDEFTVAQKATSILEVLESTQKIDFEALFTKDFTKSEIVTTFQALLELLKYQYLCVSQEGAFGRITISNNPDRPKEAYLGQLDEYN